MPHEAEQLPASRHPFIDQFAAAWAAPTLDSLMAPLREDVTLIQPLSPPLRGKPAAMRAFRRILAQYPGLRGDVHGGLGEDSVVLIDWTMKVPVGRRVLDIPVIDRFDLHDASVPSGDGVVMKRVAYFDPTPILRATLTSPVSWARQLRAAFMS